MCNCLYSKQKGQYKKLVVQNPKLLPFYIYIIYISTDTIPEECCINDSWMVECARWLPVREEGVKGKKVCYYVIVM